MGLGRRKVTLEDQDGWIFNRMADVYDARPAYPPALIDTLCSGLGDAARVVDVGAGIGHLSVPLAQRGFRVRAVEPAVAMLERLRGRAGDLPIEALHGTAEALPVPDACADLVVVADALHFLDAERTGNEIDRVLVPGGTLALVTAELADTPFMQKLVALMAEAAPRRPRAIANTEAQVLSLAGIAETVSTRFEDHAPVDEASLLRILRSISFIGPAMNPERFGAFRERVLALSGERVWSRVLTLRLGTCTRR
jgi:ubiquinone/menaquinone biosynthesis C-methylase UbiE